MIKLPIVIYFTIILASTGNIFDGGTEDLISTLVCLLDVEAESWVYGVLI
jgi:hypothetical protein